MSVNAFDSAQFAQFVRFANSATIRNDENSVARLDTTTAMMAAVPGLKAELKACKSGEDFEAAFQKYGPTIQSHLVIMGEAPVGTEGERARKMLEANAALREKPGAVLCQDPETKAFAAIRSIPLQLADPDFLAESVGDVVKTGAAWG